MNIREAIFLAKMVFKWVATVLGHLNRLVDKHCLKRVSATLFPKFKQIYNYKHATHLSVLIQTRAQLGSFSHSRSASFIVVLAFKTFSGICIWRKLAKWSHGRSRSSFYARWFSFRRSISKWKVSRSWCILLVWWIKIWRFDTCVNNCRQNTIYVAQWLFRSMIPWNRTTSCKLLGTFDQMVVATYFWCQNDPR